MTYNMGYHDDEDYLDLGIKKTNIDKLTYKYTIQKIIDRCLQAQGQINYDEYVRAYVKALEFDVKGYKFLTQIHKVLNRLEYQKKTLLLEYITTHWYEARNPKYLIPFRMKIYVLYYETLFRELQQMVANEDLLLETGKHVPIRLKQ